MPMPVDATNPIAPPFRPRAEVVAASAGCSFADMLLLRGGESGSRWYIPYHPRGFWASVDGADSVVNSGFCRLIRLPARCQPTPSGHVQGLDNLKPLPLAPPGAWLNPGK